MYQGKKFVDGSFVANYPLNILFKEVDTFSRHNNKIRLAGVVSIGTGEPAQSERKYKSGTTIRSRAKNMAHLSTLILEQVVGQDLTAVEMAQERCHAHNIPFIRISPKVPYFVRMDGYCNQSIDHQNFRESMCVSIRSTMAS
ncbi:unnamed protein product [Heligmosomoides polygyrus]|uniref:PNPLA domain-containing protein n=1 Tax=Heligmosomoides polygyrus TaxID=6339 RepID=A0A183GPJ8_HELPZ|nr:unnamed protein product [Heligmosomoides polygyrus]